MFALGLAMQGKLYAGAHDILELLGLAGDLGNGLLYVVSRAAGLGAESVQVTVADWGTRFIVVAGRMERMESFQMVMALLVQPMIFLSGALFPLENLPGWLAVLCRLNPATYGIDLCRRALLPHPQALTIGDWLVPVWFDVAVVLVLGAAMLAIAVRSFGKIE